MRRTRAVAGVFLAAAITLVACSSGVARPSDAAGGGSTAPTPTPGQAADGAPAGDTTPTTAATTTAPNRRGSGEPVTIAFAGDINFEGEMATRLANDPSNAIGPFSAILANADVAVANLETALGTKGAPEAKEFTFEAPPAAVDALRAAGLDAVSMANNHGRDFGPDGLVDSLALKDLQPDHFIIGIGHDEADALAPFTATVKGQRISLIAATQVLDEELIGAWTATPTHPGLASAKRVAQLVAAVQAARASSDTVVVFLHWGIETNTCPSGTQQTLAQQLVDAGADIVVGGLAHRLQGAGRLGEAFVAYGLGNFAFYAGSAEAARTGVIELTVTGRDVDSYRFIPGKITARVPRPLEGAAAADALAYWESLRPCTGLTK
jgi:poly-gamma-glutamate synthesis protein (capsule biosynthesis protein)